MWDSVSYYQTSVNKVSFFVEKQRQRPAAKAHARVAQQSTIVLFRHSETHRHDSQQLVCAHHKQFPAEHHTVQVGAGQHEFSREEHMRKLQVHATGSALHHTQGTALLGRRQVYIT